MLPRSDDIEALHARVKRLSADLKKLKSAEVTKAELKSELAATAREWLRLSPTFRDSGVCAPERLDAYDKDMQDVLTSTTARARASAYRTKLAPFELHIFDDVVVPLIKLEGSPRQVASRQVLLAFLGSGLTTEETTYIEEAARCVTVQSFRAALIMLWAASIARIHAAVIKRGFDAYNRAVDAVVGRKGAPFNRVKEGAKISSLPELQRSRDADLLVVGMELFKYDLQVFQELDRLLGIRNDAAHPGMAQPGALDVQQFATKLSTLVFGHVRI